jgi:uncharacterized metal-binding protein (TIGR02443 family)
MRYMADFVLNCPRCGTVDSMTLLQNDGLHHCSECDYKNKKDAINEEWVQIKKKLGAIIDEEKELYVFLNGKPMPLDVFNKLHTQKLWEVIHLKD